MSTSDNHDGECEPRCRARHDAAPLLYPHCCCRWVGRDDDPPGISEAEAALG